MTNKERIEWTRKIYKKMLRVLKRDELEVRVRSLPGKLEGYCLGDLVVISPKAEAILSVFVHELMHLVENNCSEKDTMKKEKRFMKHASWRMKKRLLQELLDRG